MNIKKILQESGINLNGPNPWDPKIHNPKTIERILSEGSLGMGESYMDGWWDCEEIDTLVYKIIKSKINFSIMNFSFLFSIIKAKLLNLQNLKRASKVGKVHYDIGNDLYKNMLDKRMVYSCAYWHNAKNLDQAQEAKLDLICKKLHLKKGMRVLDIGCGWGSFAKFAAEKYQVSVLGITISQEQASLAKKICKGLPIEIRLQDYRSINEKFDAIASIGMFEHVGCKNYKNYMQVVAKALKDDGLFLLHTIGANITTCHANEPWIEKYIFPNSMLPSVKWISKATEGIFLIEDWHNFGADYDLTLKSWYKNFEDNWPIIKNNYSDRFYRMWCYYLLAMSGAFRSRAIQCWQILFSKHGIDGGFNYYLRWMNDRS